jgi:hypothetical protein
MVERQIAIVSCVAAAALLSSCGSSSTVVEVGPGRVENPAVPTAKSCAVRAADRVASPRTASGSAQPGRPRPPAAGVYAYRTTGRSGAPSEAVRSGDLPARTELVVTESRRFGDLVCFRMQKRYGPGLANTETYVIRDDELFLVGIRIDALGASEGVRPSPPVLFASDAGAARWSGRFSGATRGSYSATGLGAGSYQLGDRSLRVIGLRSVVNYRGVVSGTQAATTWFTVGGRLIVSEEVTLRERLGVTEVRVHLRRSLLGPNH